MKSETEESLFIITLFSELKGLRRLNFHQVSNQLVASRQSHAPASQARGAARNRAEQIAEPPGLGAELGVSCVRAYGVSGWLGPAGISGFVVSPCPRVSGWEHPSAADPMVQQLE